MKELSNESPAPELSVSRWLNCEGPMSLAELRGRPVLIHAFQMLCPGCVSHAIPQTQRAHEMFSQTDLAVIGLHTVFEHHEAMTPVALKAFIHEYRLTFPIGIDEAGRPGPLPVTMSAYGMKGTPTTLIINRAGQTATQLFGPVQDMALGAIIQSAMDTGSTGSVPAVPLL